MRTIFNRLFKKENGTSFKDFLKEFNKSISLIIDKDLLLINILSKLEWLMKADKIYLFMLEPNLNRYQLYNSTGIYQSIETLKLSPESPIIRWLMINEKPLFVEKYLYSFGDDEKRTFVNHSVKVLLPLRVLNKLTGILIVCGSGKTEKQIIENIDLISIAADHTAMAFENAILYEQQKDRIKSMYRAEQLSVLGQLAAGAAHEIRNPLSIIRSTIQFLKDEVQDKEMVSELIEEVDRINSIIQGLLNFAKPAELNYEVFSLEALLLQSISLGKTAAGNSIDIILNSHCVDSEIRADSAQLKQVFLNLLLNAIDAVKNTKQGLIKVVLNKSNLHDGSKTIYIIEIHDNGYGISTENIEKLFIPFFTTKEQGTGLGLSICYGIINRHGGDISISSEQGQGTSIYIKLPQ